MAKYRVAVVIPVFNQWQLTADCLRSLRAYTPAEDVQVIVVDNGSTDETAGACGRLGHELFGKRFEHVRLDENINFGPGCNLGASRADADFLFFLNNDTLLTPGWLPPQLAAFETDAGLGAVGPLLLYPDSDRVQHLGVTFTPNSHVAHLYEYFPSTHRVIWSRRDLQAITGAALMLPASVFDQVGGFWPEYRNGYEDLDLCRQIRLMGRTLRCEPKSRVYHLTSQTPGRFDSEDHNARILLGRCSGGFQPDLHAWAAQDGYALRLGQDLTANVVLVRAPEETAWFALDRLWAEVLAEPLWEEGYNRLVMEFFKLRMWGKALDVLQLQQCFFSSEEIIINMARVATRTNDTILAAQCQSGLSKVRAAASSKDLYQKMLSVKRWAASVDDQVLLAACQQWETQYAGSAKR